MDPALLDSIAEIDDRQAAETYISLDQALAALNTFPEEQRSVLLLVCVEGLSYKEVAEVLDLELGTVMSRLARARSKLRQLLRDDETAERISH